MALAPKSLVARGALRPRNFKPTPNAARSGNVGGQQIINMTLDEVRGLFWDQKAIDTAVDKAAFRVNSKAAAYCRTTARRSMRWRKRATTMQGVKDPKKREWYRRARIAWHISGSDPGKEPRLPYPSSPAGTPPYAIREPGRGQLRRFLFSVVLRDSRNALIGPIRLGSALRAKVPGLHEHGGTQTVGRKARSVRYLPRPYMVPARDATAPRMAAMWANAVRRG